jgi:AAA15 family ATPase/GTPase
MLLNYGAKNFFCFKEGAEVSFEFPSKCPKSITGGFPVSPVICVNGTNASGKTNLLKIITFIGYFIQESFNEKEDHPIPFYSFFNNDKPSSFYLEYMVSGEVCLYELECTRKAVISEKLTKKGKLVFERKDDQIVECDDTLKKYKDVTLKPNASVICTLVNGHRVEALKPVYEYWLFGASNLHWSGYRNVNEIKHIENSFIYQKDKSFANFTTQLLVKVDPSIKSFELRERTNAKGEKFYLPVFTHKLENGREAKLDFDLQSNGTKILYNECIRILHTLAHGGSLVFDELDANLHPDIIALILELFTHKENNTNGAQIIFTSHNSEVLNMISKYQLYIVEKENSESYAYRADEIEENVIRTDRPIRTYYEKNMLGGRPKIDSSVQLPLIIK